MLPIPTCWYLKTLVDPARTPTCASLPCTWYNTDTLSALHPWAVCLGGRIGHVDFMLFAYFSFALSTQCERGY